MSSHVSRLREAAPAEEPARVDRVRTFGPVSGSLRWSTQQHPPEVPGLGGRARRAVLAVRAPHQWLPDPASNQSQVTKAQLSELLLINQVVSIGAQAACVLAFLRPEPAALCLILSPWTRQQQRAWPGHGFEPQL